MTTNALLIDLDPLFSDPLSPPPTILSSATLASFQPDLQTGEELTRLRRQLKAADHEIETLEDELREAVAASRDERAEKKPKEKELVELKKRMGVTRAKLETKEAQDATRSQEERSPQPPEVGSSDRPASPAPSPATRDSGLNTELPAQESSTIPVSDPQTSKPVLQGPDACCSPQSQSAEIVASPTPTSPGATTLGSPATFSSFFAKALADVSRDSSTASETTCVKSNTSGNSGTSTPPMHDPARAQTMVLLNQVRSEKRALEIKVHELIAQTTSLRTEKSAIQKRLDETQKARLALEKKIDGLQSTGSQPANKAASLPTKPDQSVSILSDLQSRYSGLEKRLQNSQTEIAGLERHLREWKTKANKLEIKLRAAQKGSAKIDSAAKATVAGTVELNALKDKLASVKKDLEGMRAKFEAQGQLLAEARKREVVERQKVELLEEELRVALKS